MRDIGRLSCDRCENGNDEVQPRIQSRNCAEIACFVRKPSVFRVSRSVFLREAGRVSKLDVPSRILFRGQLKVVSMEKSPKLVLPTARKFLVLSSLGEETAPKPFSSHVSSSKREKRFAFHFQTSSSEDHPTSTHSAPCIVCISSSPLPS